jgi:hypothetical protein
VEYNSGTLAYTKLSNKSSMSIVATTPRTSQQVKGSGELMSRCPPACTTHTLPFPITHHKPHLSSLFMDNLVPISEDRYIHAVRLDGQSLPTGADDRNIRDIFTINTIIITWLPYHHHLVVRVLIFPRDGLRWNIAEHQ